MKIGYTRVSTGGQTYHLQLVCVRAEWLQLQATLEIARPSDNVGRLAARLAR